MIIDGEKQEGPDSESITHMQAIRQKRSVATPTKTAVKAIRRFPSILSRVRVAPITGPLDQLIQVPKWTSFFAIAAPSAHAAWCIISASTEVVTNNRLTNT